jgi:hypothetical protein
VRVVRRAAVVALGSGVMALGAASAAREPVKVSPVL